ncbi:MAG TPA: hypothetical protein VG269_21785 [Tepidisphaeraceae bacterium]|nr:hypothetical protein [Tepidisphaeraceae bacterium]
MSDSPPSTRLKFALHGPAVVLDNAVPALDAAIDSLLAPFAVPGWPEGFLPASGVIRPFDQSEVQRCLSPTARHLTRTPGLMDIYEEGERFWIADDRWGIAEINLLRAQWRSWILPRPALDPFRIVEAAILWPLAQLLRSRGVHLLPATSAVRDGFAFLLICPFSPDPELTALTTEGYKIIGRRWTALREEDGRVALLHLPGWAPNRTTPSLRLSLHTRSPWKESAPGLPTPWQNHAFCDAVLIGEAARRPSASLKETSPAEAAQFLRQSWPILELHPARRQSVMPARLSQGCTCHALQLSQNPKDLPPLLHLLRTGHKIPAEDRYARA